MTDRQGMQRASGTCNGESWVYWMTKLSAVVPQFGGGFFGGGLGARNRSLTVTWSNDESELHYVVVESRVEGEPEYILPDQLRLGQ